MAGKKTTTKKATKATKPAKATNTKVETKQPKAKKADGKLSAIGGLGSGKAYRSVFKKVLANYHKESDPTFRATEAMVENVRAKPINKIAPADLEISPAQGRGGLPYPDPRRVR